MNKEAEKKKCIYDSVRISKNGIDSAIFILALALLTLILYAIVVSA